MTVADPLSRLNADVASKGRDGDYGVGRNDHHSQPPLPTPRPHLSFSLPLLYHFHSISCFPFSVAAKPNYICISVPTLPVCHPVSYTQVTCLIFLLCSKQFISFRVCVCVCVGVIRNHLVIALFFFYRIFTQISLCRHFSLLCEFCGISFVCCIVCRPTSKATSNAA